MGTDMNTNLELLAQRMTAKEEAAFQEFGALFGPRFRALFRRKGLSPVEAEDLAVDCVTDIALKVERYDMARGGRFAAWVFTLANRALTDWWRHHHAFEPLPAEVAFVGSTGEESGGDLAGAVEALREAVAKLPPGEQALVRARDFGGGDSYARIAAELEIEPSAARVRHHRALRRLRNLLEPDPRIQRLLLRGSAA